MQRVAADGACQSVIRACAVFMGVRATGSADSIYGIGAFVRLVMGTLAAYLADVAGIGA